MRILLLNQFFWPDTAATGQLLGDLANHLVSSGHTVDVICGSANYGGQNNFACPSVGVTRLQTTAYSPGMGGRLGSFLSFLVGAFWHGMRLPAPDVVVTLTTPPLLSLVGITIQKLRGARHIVWEMDVYPDVAVDLGVLKPNGFSAKFFGWLADLPRRHADRVIALGECMRLRLLSHGLDGDKVCVAENWADCTALPANEQNEQLIPSAGVSIVYSGNFGRAHDVETIAGAMAELNNADEGFQFVFGGGGSQQTWIRDFCEKNAIGNAQFLPYCERDELSARLASGDIGLVTQHAATAGSVVASKAYGIMAAGRPVLYIGPRNSTTSLMIERYECGWHVDCDDVKGLVALLRHLAENKELIRAAGERAYQAFIDNFQRSVGVTRLAALLEPDAVSETVPMAIPATRRGMFQMVE
jgi:colanic acid biosynthesis glycosyl transferase WcaI